MKTVASVVVALVLSGAVGAAQTPPEISLWKSGAPGSEGKNAKEAVTTSASGELSVSSIHNPSITPYLPSKDKANGTAILVIPGGGHRMLAITHEGYNVAEWLRDHGIAAFVLKHRLAREPESTYRIDVESLADTQRAIRVIRSHASEWNIDAGRIGAIGFSAGGELVSMAATKPDSGNASAADPIDRESSKLDFQALIYPGRSGDIQPTKESPPVFLAASYTDRQDISEGLAEAYLRFKRAGVVAELHIYSTGGHGFGLRSTNRQPGRQLDCAVRGVDEGEWVRALIVPQGGRRLTDLPVIDRSGHRRPCSRPLYSSTSVTSSSSSPQGDGWGPGTMPAISGSSSLLLAGLDALRVAASMRRAVFCCCFSCRARSRARLFWVGRDFCTVTSRPRHP